MDYRMVFILQKVVMDLKMHISGLPTLELAKIIYKYIIKKINFKRNL